MEGFPAPDAKTIMEAMEDDESEKLVDVMCVPGGEQSVVNLSEMRRRLTSIAEGSSRELVGDIQLADDDEDNEEEDAKNLLWKEHVLRVKSIPVSKESTSVELGSEMAIKVFDRQVREEHECIKLKRQQTIGGFCCMNGFLSKENHQQKEDDYEKKLMVKGRSNLSCKERLLPRGRAALYSTGQKSLRSSILGSVQCKD